MTDFLKTECLTRESNITHCLFLRTVLTALVASDQDTNPLVYQGGNE